MPGASEPTPRISVSDPTAPGSPQLLTCTLAGSEDLGGGYYVLTFEAEQALDAQAGHFAMVRSPGWGDSPLLPRPMSLLTAGAQPSMLVKVVGEGTRRMAAAPQGETFTLLAPLGTTWGHPEPTSTPVLVAGGVGVAPLLFLARELHAAGHRKGGQRPPVVACYGGRTAGDLPLVDDLGKVAACLIATEDGSKGGRGLVTVPLERLLESPQRGNSLAIYACGPHGMMAAVARLAAQHQVTCRVSLEALMACGYGVCLGCATARPEGGYLYTCTEGPCADAAAVDWSQTGMP